MKKYLKNWNFVRVMRLAIGTIVVGHGFYENEWLFVLLGGFFSLMPLFNLGCSSCEISISKDEDNPALELVYEEVNKNTSSTD